MRITGGCWRSHGLRGPSRNMPLRPTPDALRERAFAVLGERVNDAVFLDLYAGTGAVGLEALSRGARSAVFVEQHAAAGRIIAGNLKAVGADESATRIMIRPAERALSELSRRQHRFDLVWADPPFPIWEEGAQVLAEVARIGLLSDDSLLCLECPDRADVTSLPENLEVVRDLGKGASRVVLIRAVGQHETPPINLRESAAGG